MEKTESEDRNEPLVDQLDQARAKIARLNQSVEAYKTRLAEAETYRRYLDEAPSPLFSVTPQGRYTYANRALARALGKPIEDIIRQGMWDTFPKPEADRRFASLAEIFRTGKPSTQEGVVPNTDGSARYFSTAIAPIQDATGATVSVICAATDITDRKRAEDASKESRERYRSLSEASFEAIFISENAVCVDQNGSAEQMFGYALSEALGRHGTEWLAPPDRDLAMRNMLSGSEQPYEVTALRKDGTTFPAQLRGKKMNIEGRNVRVTSLSDITERKRAEATLRQSEERYRALIEWLSETILVHRSGKVVYANPAAVKLFGASTAADLLGKPILDLVHPDFHERVKARVAIAAQGTGSTSLEQRFLRLDGTPIDVEVQGERMTFDGVPAIYAVIRDVTERHRADATRAQLEAQLQQSQKMESVGRLAGGVAHDFNNMLAVILGNVELAMQQVQPGGPVHADLNEIRTAATRSADLTRQLLAFARKQVISPKILDVNATLSGLLGMLRRLIGEDITLTWTPAPDLWPVRVDPSQIDQILVNLCVNARDAISGVGKVTVETHNRTLDEAYCADHAGVVPGEYVLIVVSDDGCGMDQETLASAFEPFFTTKEMGKGTGLGLAMVFGAVQQNHGFINVYSEPGLGTTFTIHLPRHQAKAHPPTPTADLTPATRGHETILLVEDEPAILKLTTRLLEASGYTVLAAGTPGEALRLANEHPGAIDLLLTDVVMPEMNGRDLARNLLSIYPSMKRLFTSGYTANVIAHHGVLDGGVNFLQKPFSAATLAAAVRAAIEPANS